MTAVTFRELLDALAWGIGAGLLLMIAGAVDTARNSGGRKGGSTCD
ncbi:hypothetical protein [Streptomyces caniferus]